MLAILSVACGTRCGDPAARAAHAVPRAGPRVQNTDIEVQNYDIEVQNFDVEVMNFEIEVMNFEIEVLDFDIKVPTISVTDFVWNNTHSTEFKDWRIGKPLRYRNPLDFQLWTILNLS